MDWMWKVKERSGSIQGLQSACEKFEWISVRSLVRRARLGVINSKEVV